MPKNVGDLGKFIVAKGFKKLPNVVSLAITQIIQKQYALDMPISDVGKVFGCSNCSPL